MIIVWINFIGKTSPVVGKNEDLECAYSKELVHQNS